jgi:hypothetical protein
MQLFLSGEADNIYVTTKMVGQNAETMRLEPSGWELKEPFDICAMGSVSGELYRKLPSGINNHVLTHV